MATTVSEELGRYFERVGVDVYSDSDMFSHLLAAGVALALKSGMDPVLLTVQLSKLIEMVADGELPEEIAAAVPMFGQERKEPN
jgi:hypothetical protein